MTKRTDELTFESVVAAAQEARIAPLETIAKDLAPCRERIAELLLMGLDPLYEFLAGADGFNLPTRVSWSDQEADEGTIPPGYVRLRNALAVLFE